MELAMVSSHLIERFLASSKSDEEHAELVHWLSLAVCPQCFSEDIKISWGVGVDEGLNLCGEAINCSCQRIACLHSTYSTIGMDE